LPVCRHVLTSVCAVQTCYDAISMSDGQGNTSRPTAHRVALDPAGMARRAVAQELGGIDTYCASQAYLVLNSWRNFPHASRDRAAICRNYLAGSLSDLSWRLPDAGFLPEIPRMDPMAVCGQSDLRRPFVLCVECFGLRFRDFSSAPDLFSRSFLRTASPDRQKVAVILACGSEPVVQTNAKVWAAFMAERSD